MGWGSRAPPNPQPGARPDNLRETDRCPPTSRSSSSRTSTSSERAESWCACAPASLGTISFLAQLAVPATTAAVKRIEHDRAVALARAEKAKKEAREARRQDQRPHRDHHPEGGRRRPPLRLGHRQGHRVCVCRQGRRSSTVARSCFQRASRRSARSSLRSRWFPTSSRRSRWKSSPSSAIKSRFPGAPSSSRSGRRALEVPTCGEAARCRWASVGFDRGSKGAFLLTTSTRRPPSSRR